MKRIVLFFCLYLTSFSVFGQGWKIDYSLTSATAVGSSAVLPFWARTVKGGYMSDVTSTLLSGGGDVLYMASNGLYFGAGANLVGCIAAGRSVSDSRVTGLVDRLYLSAGWRMLHADIGLKPRQQELCDLSLTGGDIIMSGYARNLPGVNLWSDWIYFEKGHWVGIKGNFSHYQMLDNRYVKGTLVHNKSLAFKVALGRKVDLEAGLDHWVQWGGVSPDHGTLPHSWKDYWRVIFALPGGSDAPDGDRQNALGNHLGREYVRLRWRARKFVMTAQYDMPFEDGRGAIKIQNAPDGVYSLIFNLNDRGGFVTDVLYEYVHTTWQSGDVHDRPATEEEMTKVYPDHVDAYWQRPDDFYYGRIVLGGMDTYFNSLDYKSGWTYHGRIIGLPLMTPEAVGEDGKVPGVVNNRIRAHHVGLKGNAGMLPYCFKATYSSNWGNFGMSGDSIFNSRPWQLSLALELDFGRVVTNLPVSLSVGAYGDIGKLYRNCFGLTMKISASGSKSPVPVRL